MKKLTLLFFSILTLPCIAQQKLEATETEALLTVSVINGSGVPQEGESVSFESQTTKKVYSGITGADGKFALLIPEGEDYKVKYKSFSDDKDYNVLKVPNKEGTINFNYNIKVELPKTYTLKNVFFDTGKSIIRPESFKELNNLAEFMKLKKALIIEIAGHTDNVGDPVANMKLSEERAKSVRDYLVRKGIDVSRVSAKGYGPTQPIADNDSKEGKQQNRRTEVRIIKE